MADNYTISTFSDISRIGEIMELFATGLGETSREHWQWRLFSPDNPYRNILTIAEDTCGKAVGMCTVIPAVYGIGTDKRLCIQFGDWVVHPDHRGKGLISLMYKHNIEHFTAQGYDFVIEFPNDNSYPIFKKYGFSQLSDIELHTTNKKLLGIKRSPSNFTCGDVLGIFSDTCPTDITFSNTKNKIYRTYEFMHWKFDLNPDTNYKWLSLKQNGEYIGYFVYTLVKGRLNTALNIYDFEYSYPSPEPFKKAIKQLHKISSYVAIWGKYDEQTTKLFEASGIVNKRPAARLMLKAISEKGFDDNITLTRIDTDY